MNNNEQGSADYLKSQEARETAQKYADIIHAERPVTEESLRKHPRMTLENRAKIFSPFAALRGYEQKIAAEGMKMLRVPFLELSEGEKEKLSSKLAFVQKGMELQVLYFVPDTEEEAEPIMGTYRECAGQVIRMDPIEQIICVENQVIPFKWIHDIAGPMIPEQGKRLIRSPVYYK